MQQAAIATIAHSDLFGIVFLGERLLIQEMNNIVVH